MKKLTLLFFFIATQALAFDAVVIVLEAPLLKEPALNARVLQTLRKGEKVYVPNEIGSRDRLPAFVQTYDRVGNIAYIPSRYIKLITNDQRENKMPISLSHDPTDYRLEEPIPSTYPFDNTSFLRASVYAFFAPNASSSYAYNYFYRKQEFTSETGLKLNVTRKVSFDRWDRFYFGGTGSITTSGNTVYFEQNAKAEESRSTFKLGPLLTYDAYKTQNYRFTLGTGFTYNYQRAFIKLRGFRASEERYFSGYSMSPFTSLYAQATEVLPNIDLIAGADINFNLPYTLKTDSPASIPEIWSDAAPNDLKSEFKTQASFLLGVQYRY